MTYDDLEQQMNLRFQSTLPRGEQLNMSKLPPPRNVPQPVSSCLKIDLRECFGTAPLPTGTSGASRRGEGGLLTGLRHGSPAHKYLSGIPAWRRWLLTGLRHGHPAHRCLSGILAWQRGLLTGPRHGTPDHRHFSGIPACRHRQNREDAATDSDKNHYLAGGLDKPDRFSR